MPNLSWLYLAILVFSLIGMTLIDFRYKVCLFADWRRWSKTLGAAIAAFLTFDYIAIALGIFIAGTSEFASGIFLPGQMPIEEPLFLLLLTYLACQLLVLFNRVGGGKN